MAMGLFHGYNTIIAFNSIAMNPHMWVKDVWWVYGCPKNDLILKISMCHYLN